MRLQMGPQIGLVRKTASAISASKGFFTGMSAHVALQKPRPREAFAANVAFAWQRVRTYVHFKGGQRGVAFVAKFAAEAFGNLVVAMQL